jgi:hypothetical protein
VRATTVSISSRPVRRMVENAPHRAHRRRISVKYMLMFISDDSNWDPSKPETQAAYKRIGEWFEEHTKSGKITGGEELKSTNTATTVRQRNGKITVTDGPFAESKEAIGGYALVDVKDLDEAVAMAKTWPALSAIEIRPLVTHDDPSARLEP